MEAKIPSITITSSAFKDKAYIPQVYTGDGDNANPPLTFGNPPKGTQSFTLIVDDPDAPSGMFTHWIVFNIPAQTRTVNEGETPEDAIVGSNSAGYSAYLGPAPPPGKPHRYIFRLFALDTMLSLDEGSTREAVVAAIKGHILAQGSLTGLYKR